MTKVCSICRTEKDIEAFWWSSKTRGHRYSACAECSSEESARWPAASYKRVQKFSRDEEYMIRKVAEKPTRSKALDGLFRRNPRRWHQVMVASVLTRQSA